MQSDQTQSAPDADCPVCRSNQGLERISPGPTIYMGRSWQVEHAYPTSLLGWLVIVLKRHAEGLHELTEDEATELGMLQRVVAQALREHLGCEKEYSVCFGEAQNFSHLHFHLIPRAGDVPNDLKGTGVFQHLKRPDQAVPRDAVAALCAEISELVQDRLSL